MRALLSPSDERLLLELLSIDTTTPMEAEAVTDLRAAQELVLQAAEPLGFEVAHFESPSDSCLRAEHVPLSVVERSAALGPAFLSGQPNLVLRLGRRDEPTTVVFNVHLDTVSGYATPVRRGERIFGRGAIDAKGLAVAVLAGAREAIQEMPDLAEAVTILLQLVGGEEGGAMGVYGTRCLVEHGFVGRLNVVAEPTALRYFDQTTTSMTARIDVDGLGATDDQPEAGENATILLAALVERLTRKLAGRVEKLGGRMCVAGLHTGETHNRVFGKGRLYLNFAYPSLRAAEAIEQAAEEEFERAVDDIAATYAAVSVARLSAASARRVCRLLWTKRRLPVLSNSDRVMEGVLAAAGLRRHEAAGMRPFTCDAMWFAGEDRYTIVFGPGDAAANHAHADGEFVDLGDLDRYAAAVVRLLHSFRAWVGVPR